MEISLKVIVVDDEELTRQMLCSMITEYCPHLHVVGSAASAQEARALVAEYEPDVMFLDITMPEEDGFDLLESLKESNLLFVFITAYDQFALQAIKVSAVDYLLKPIKIRELRQVQDKLLKQYNLRLFGTINQQTHKAWIEALLHNMQNEHSRKVTLSYANRFDIVDMDDIIRLEADRNYSKVYLNTQGQVLVSRTLTDFENILDKELFARIHKSHLINLSYLSGYISEDAGYAIMQDGKRLEISRRKAHEFFDKVRKFTRCIRK